jgi:predicted DNA-binding protein YlxM (UPF0122 family)
MSEEEKPQNFPQEMLTPKSVFETTAPGSPPALVAFLQLAEIEGAYAKLTSKRREILEKYYVAGLSQVQIAGDFHVSKQAISQSLRLSPESLYQQMLVDVVMHRTNIPFEEISTTHKAYRLESDTIKKSGE